MTIYFNPLSEEYKSVTGAISDREELFLAVKIAGGEKCRLHLFSDENGEETVFDMEKRDELFAVKLPALKAGLYFYCNKGMQDRIRAISQHTDAKQGKKSKLHFFSPHIHIY